MNEVNKNERLLRELIRKREKETLAFRKLLKAMQERQKTDFNYKTAANAGSSQNEAPDDNVGNLKP